MKHPKWARGEVQTLMFPRSRYSAGEAKRWAKDHGFRATKVDTTDEYHRLRQRDPKDFDEFRTFELGDGIKGVYGRVKGRKANEEHGEAADDREPNPAPHEEKWIATVHLKRGRLHHYFGIPAGETIPMRDINAELRRLQKMRDKRKPKRFTKAELSLYRALVLARRFKGYARERRGNPAPPDGGGGCIPVPVRRDNGTFIDLTAEAEQMKKGGLRRANPVTLMNVANLVPHLANLMVGRAPNPDEIKFVEYEGLPHKALFIADVARTQRGDARLAVKLSNGMARHVTGPHKGRNFRVPKKAKVASVGRRLDRLPRKR